MQIAEKLRLKQSAHSSGKMVAGSRPHEQAQLIIQPTRGLASLRLGDLWDYRELLYFLVWRDIKVRYKQTVLGVVWVVLQPLIATLIFTVVFGMLAKMPSNGIPYPVFAFSALLPWNYFASALSQSGMSLVNSANLITKIYFPRLLIPIAGAIACLLDFVISFALLLAIMLFYRVSLGWGILMLPLFLLMAVGTACGISLWLSALSVQYRDIKHLIPFLVQAWMYATPVVYPASLFPEKWRPLLGLNPMTGVIEGFRWALTGGGEASALMLLVSTVVAVCLIGSGLIFFRNTERTFADVV